MLEDVTGHAPAGQIQPSLSLNEEKKQALTAYGQMRAKKMLHGGHNKPPRSQLLYFPKAR